MSDLHKMTDHQIINAGNVSFLSKKEVDPPWALVFRVVLRGVMVVQAHVVNGH